MNRPLAAALALTVAAVSCIDDGHPLGTDGAVEIRIEVDGPLFATDEVDPSGTPTGPRQTPYRTDVLLRLTEEEEVGHGGVVSVHVEPAEALVVGEALDPTAEGGLHENETDPACALVDGAFQCRGNIEGFARFSLTSPADWSGTARLVISWSNRTEERDIDVLPGGLPESASNFSLIGLTDGEDIPATYLGLTCTDDAQPGTGSPWPEGRTRFRELFARATPPAASPGVVENAPVIIESLSAEGALSLEADCVDRTTRLRVLLDSKGETQRFYGCFSDVGGELAFGVSSGDKVLEPPPVIVVAPEPHLLRVRVLDGKSIIETSFSPEDLFEVGAFDVNLRAIQIPLDLALSGSGLILTSNSAETASEGNAPAIVAATPTVAGVAELLVTPRLRAQPECRSSTVTIVEP